MASSTMTIRLDEEEKELIASRAKTDGTSASEFVRRAVLGRVRDFNAGDYLPQTMPGLRESASEQRGYALEASEYAASTSSSNTSNNTGESLVGNFGSLVFNEREMERYLPADVFEKLMATAHEGTPLDADVAVVVAEAMMNWALSKGATHYTHWFQPLSGTTSEKHDAFLDPVGDGTAITKFSANELVSRESDASSFPSGGLRATFEARGYTAWDPTSYAFIKDEVLCIPTAFCSYTGEALDKKTPLLRSMGVLSKQTKRLLACFGETPKQIVATMGAEQEFFLIPKEDYAAREDLVMTGRTLFGSAPCKGQELEEHYYGSIRPTVNNFMKELDKELWALGIAAKTKHNEVAPAQHELAPVYTNANRGVDENLLTMEKMTLLASHYGLVCLTHEKPFDGINGSGKHNNWSISADDKNLFDPGENPMENLRFLVLLTCVIEAVDNYQDLLRMSVASAGNDHRLGANEAPPAIVSIYLGEELGAIVDALVHGTNYTSAEKVAMDLGVSVLPNFLKDNTDRNRTSPFAFTGNKFEFRMPGSNVNLSDSTMVLNTAVAKSFKDFADAMEGLTGAAFEKEAIAYVTASLCAHERIIFNGNGYAGEWEEEAKRRGLSNNRTTADALPCFVEPKNVALFEEMGVLSEVECTSRYEVKLEKYNKLINIEARVMQRMTRRTYLPAINRYASDVAENIRRFNEARAIIGAADAPDIGAPADISQATLLHNLLAGIENITAALYELDRVQNKALGYEDQQERARYNAYTVVPAMETLRAMVDAMEVITDRSYWPAPSYNNMLFYV